MQNIPENWRDSPFTIIETSRVIAQQHDALPRKEYEKWLALQPVGTTSTANKLAKIAKNQVIADPIYTAKLPPDWGKLYEASFLPEVFLREKISNGRLAELTRFDIYAIRKRKSKNRTEPKDNPKPVKAGKGGKKISIPPKYSRLSEWTRAGMAMEVADNLSPSEAALAVGMRENTYSQARTVVMLYDRNDLSAEDRRLVSDAVVEMDLTRSVRGPYFNVRPLLTKVYGVDGRLGRRIQAPRYDKKRQEDFAKAISVINDTCVNAVDIRIPLMGSKELAAAVKRIQESRQALNQLVKNLRRSVNG